jgi:hypothetical protein
VNAFRKRGAHRSDAKGVQYDLLASRSWERNRAQLQELGRKRRAVLTAEMKGLLRFPATFEVEDGNHYDGTPQVILNNAGQARDLGFEFKELHRFRLVLQETLRVPDGRPPFYVIRYSYGFVDAETGERLFRFEYHPDLPKPGKDQRWSLIHHFHFGDDSEEQDAGEDKPSSVKPSLHKLHFPLWPFLEAPDENPHEVLPKLLQWSRDELRRIDLKPKGRL